MAHGHTQPRSTCGRWEPWCLSCSPARFCLTQARRPRTIFLIFLKTRCICRRSYTTSGRYLRRSSRAEDIRPSGLTRLANYARTVATLPPPWCSYLRTPRSDSTTTTRPSWSLGWREPFLRNRSPRFVWSFAPLWGWIRRSERPQTRSSPRRGCPCTRAEVRRQWSRGADGRKNQDRDDGNIILKGPLAIIVQGDSVSKKPATP